MRNNLDSKVAILLSVYNGSLYLKEQLDSLVNQSYKNFVIIIRDDGSSDASIKIVESYSDSLHLILLDDCQNIGVKKSFSRLLEYAIDSLDSSYFMFCDQDDIWNIDKVEKTFIRIKEMENKHKEKPILVHSDLKLIDNNYNILCSSFWKFEKINPAQNSFNNLLMHNTVTGCTMMINRLLAEKSIKIPENCIMHDWWIGLVASCFGIISYLDDSTILYRQHDKNTVGAKPFSFLSSLKKGFDSSYKAKIYLNIIQAEAFLKKYKSNLDSSTLEMLEDFTNIESQPFWKKRKILLKYKILKQGFLRNLGLLLKI